MRESPLLSTEFLIDTSTEDFILFFIDHISKHNLTIKIGNNL